MLIGLVAVVNSQSVAAFWRQFHAMLEHIYYVICQDRLHDIL